MLKKIELKVEKNEQYPFDLPRPNIELLEIALEATGDYGIQCPECKTDASDSPYPSQGMLLPGIFNYYSGSNSNGEYANWDEVHICDYCHTVFAFMGEA